MTYDKTLDQWGKSLTNSREWSDVYKAVQFSRQPGLQGLKGRALRELEAARIREKQLSVDLAEAARKEGIAGY